MGDVSIEKSTGKIVSKTTQWKNTGYLTLHGDDKGETIHGNVVVNTVINL